MIAFYILIALVVAVGIWVIFAYNTFVRLVQQTKEAWADIDVQLKRRYDVIPNLVEITKKYASHERETLEAVTQARASATQIHVDPSKITPETMAAMAGAEQGLGQALGRLLVAAEAYPELKANENFLKLHGELVDTENKIQAARRFYNGNVKDLLISLQSFPSNIVGNMFKFEAMPYFELEAGSEERENVKVGF